MSGRAHQHTARHAQRDESELPSTFADYDATPREYVLNGVSTVLDVHTRVSDLYSSPHDQIQEQLRLTIETIKERQESERINNADCGLLARVHPDQIVYPLTGAPTPDDFDELLTKVWKEPAFFLSHPLAIAAFGRECTRRGVPPPTVSLFGSQFLTWRGIPRLGFDTTGRPSLAFYNTCDEVDRFIAVIERLSAARR